MLRTLIGWLTRPPACRTPRPVTRHPFLRLESLEAREVPAGLAWTGDSTAYWSDANSWTDVSTGQNRAPTSGDTLYFGELGGTNASSIDDIPGLTAVGIAESSTYTGQLTINEQLTLSDTATLYAPTLINTGGSLSTGVIYEYSSLQVTGASSPMPPPTPSVSASLLDMPLGSSAISFAGEAVQLDITNVAMGSGSTWTEGMAGTKSWSALTVYLTGSIGSAGAITLYQGAALSVSHDFTSSAGTLNLNNGTTLTVSGTDTTVLSGTTNAAGAVHINAASVEINGSGVLNISSTASVAGVLSVSGDLGNAGGTIAFADAQGTLNVGGNFGQSSGTLSMVVSFTNNRTDTVNVQKAATLGGSLVVTGVGTRTVPLTFNIIGASQGITGDFISKSFPPGSVGAAQVQGNVYTITV